MRNLTNNNIVPASIFNGADYGVFLWACRLVLAMLALLIVNVSSASAQTQLNLSKTLCSGIASSASNCTSATMPQIGDPVYYEIAIGNTLGSTTAIELQEDYPAGFVPVFPALCYDSLGNSVLSTTIAGDPALIQLSVNPSEGVVCRLNGYFEVPGEVAINEVSETSGLSGPANHSVVIAQEANIPADLSISKTANTSGPIDLTNGSQSVTYTITIMTDRDVYLDDYLKIYDLLSLTSGSIPINANLNTGSVSCSVTSPGGSGLTCPVTNDFSGNFPNEAWTSFISFGYGNALPILFRAGDVLTLSYTVDYSISASQTCINAIDANGINNRAFLGLANGSGSQTDLNTVNNDTINSSLNTVDVYVDLPVTDDCIPPDPSPKEPSPLEVKKDYTQHITASGATSTSFPVNWDQQYVSYDITLTNTSLTEVVYDIDTYDRYSNQTYTPNHTAQLHSVDITSCPVSSVCSINQPAGWVSGMPAPQGPVQAINSYYDSATMFTGSVDVLQPGESMTYTVKLILRDPTCDFAELQQPKTVANTLLAPHKVDRLDLFSNLIIPNNFVVSDSAVIEVEKTQPCDFNVRKTVLNAPNEVDFGEPMNYTIEFENGGEPIEAGTLLDVLRIEQNYYALGMGASYSFSCQENPSGSVIDFVPSGSGNGTVSYVQHPHQGLRVMDHPGFVSFAPYAKLTCDITVTVQKPADSDPYCFTNGTPTLGNAAIIDGSLFYNTNQGWPLAPQGTMWDAVSSELPKCYHLVINKQVSPLTTTPNFGPDLTYTVTVTNASGSGTAGDVDFTPVVTTSPWTGPYFVDTFQTGPFPIAPPQNAPNMVIDPCDNTTSVPCNILSGPSTTGHEIGISKLPAGDTLTYSYDIPPNYTPHEICNDISGELLIGGASADPDRWYAKNPITLQDSDVCALIRTNLEITKTVDVHPTITLPTNTSFVVDINCTPPSGFDPVAMSQTFNMSNLVKTQPNLVVGSQCSIVERTPDESLLPSHCDWNPPTYPDGTSFLADGSVEPHKLSVHNSMTCRFGDVRVSKSVEGNATELATGGLLDFDFELSCGTPASSTYSLSVPAAGSDIFLQIPDGSACTLSETQPADYTDGEGRNCVWDTPEYSGSGVTGNMTTVSEGSIPHFIVKNKVHCTRLGSLEIRKLILATGSTPTVDPDIMFDANVSCNDLNANNVYSGTVPVSINTPYTVSNIPAPATCTVVEATPSVSDLPAHCYAWGTPSYSPNGPVTLPDEAGSSGQITMINTPICHTFGNIRVKKEIDPESAPVPLGMTYDYDMTCTDVDGNVTTNSYTIGNGATQTYTGYTTTNCTVTETLPDAPEYCSWASPQYSIPSANYTTHSGIEIAMRNKLVCPSDVIEITKTFSDDTDYTPDGQSYNVAVSCDNGANYSLPVLADGTVTTVSIPQSVSCSISETPPSNDLLPGGCSWDDPRIEPSNVTVIEGQTPKVVVENNIKCENSLDVSKTFDVPSGVDFNTNFEYTVEVRCTSPNGSPTTHYVSLSEVDSLETVDGIPLGSVCRIKEIMPADEDGLPDHCRWSKPLYPDGDTINMNDPGGDYGLSVHNKAKCYYGEVKVVKNWASSLYTTGTPQPGPAGVSYDIDLNCGSSFSDSVSLQVGAGHTFTNVPANTNCTVSETLPTSHPGTGGSKTCNFNNPSYSPSNPFTVPANSGQVITVTNSDECRFKVPPLPKGYFDVRKTVIGGGPSLQNANYDISISCGSITRTVSATPGGQNILGSFPPLMLSGQSCTVSETPDPALLPPNCTWNQPVYSVPPNFTPGFSTTGPYPIVQVMNSFTCTPMPGTLDIQKNLTVPPDFNQAIPPNYQVNVICLDVPIPPINFSSSSAPIGVGLTTNVHSGSGQICMYNEPMPTTPLPDGCSWQTPTYPNGQLVFMASNQVATGTINNQVICGTGSLTVEKTFSADSDEAALDADYQVQLNCGGPMNTSNVYPMSGASSFTEGGIAGTQCTVTELTPPEIDPDFCYWAPPTYITANSSSTNPASVVIDANNPTVVIENNLVCNRPPPDLDITKTLVGDGTCFDPVTYTFDCDYEIVITNSGGQTAEGPFTVYEDMTGVVGYFPPFATTPTSWDCNVTSSSVPADPVECISDPLLDIPPGGSTSFTVNMKGFSFYPPDENCVSIEDYNGEIVEYCIDLEGPQLEIEKVLLTPDCAQHPITECLFQVTITNVGSGDYSGLLFVNDFAESLSGLTTLPTNITTMPASPWDCGPPSAVTNGPFVGHFCWDLNANVPGNGGTTSFTIGMDGNTFRQTDEPQNCASLLLYEPEQESCVEVPWSPDPFLYITKEVVDCDATGICTFVIAVQNQSSTIDYNDPLTISDTVSLGGATYVSNTGTFNCSGTNSIDCSSNGSVTIPGGTTLSFLLTLDLNDRSTAEENCVTFTPASGIPGNEYCVPIPEQPILSIDKDKLTPGDCLQDSPLGPYLCEYSVTFTNDGPGDFNSPLSFDDVVSLNSPALGPQQASMNIGPGAPWTCSANSSVPDINCNTGTTDIFIADGDSVTITFTLEHDFPRFDENCVTLEGPLQSPKPESCVRLNNLTIEKQKLTAGDCMGMGPSPQLCEFRITVTNEGPFIFDDPFTVSDAVTGLPGVPLVNYSDQTLWNCYQTTAGVDCVYIGPQIIVGDSVDLFLTLDMANPTFVEENCASITDPELNPVPTSCVPLEETATGELNVVKVMTANSVPFAAPLNANMNFDIDVTCSTVSPSWSQTYSFTGDPLDTNGETFDIPDGAVCTVTEQPITMDPGPGCQWAPVGFYPGNTATISQGTTQTINVVNQRACIPDGALGVSKAWVSGDCYQEPCVFEITVENLTGNSISAPLSVQDAVSPAVGTYVSNTGNWTCAGTNGLFDCDSNGNVNLGPYGTEVFEITINMAVGMPLEENCVTLTSTQQVPPPEYCIPIDPVVGQQLELTKSQITPGNCHGAVVTGQPNPNHCEFSLTVTNTGPGDYVGPISLTDTVSGAAIPIVSWDFTPWSCLNPTSTEVQCDHPSTTLAQGDSLTVFVTLDIQAPLPMPENCVVLDDPLYSPPAEACIPIDQVEEQNLVLEKTFLQCQNAVCQYQISVTNLGPNDYEGPISLEDVFTSTGGGPLPNLIGTNSTDGWNCTPLGFGMNADCFTPYVDLDNGQTTTFTAQYNLPIGPDYDPTTPDPIYENCVTLNAPVMTPAPVACAATPSNGVPELEIVKTQLTQGDCGSGLTPWACEFKIVITNVGTDDYTGPLSITDALTGYPNAPILGYGDPAVWNCNSSANGAVCDYIPNSGIVTIPAGSWIELTITLDVQLPVPVQMSADENCASITEPILSPIPTSCIDLGPQPLLDIEKIKISPHKCHEFPPGATTVVNDCEFQIVISNNGPGDFNGDITISDEFGWGAPISGSSTPITWSSTPSNPAWSCVSTPTGTDCSASSVVIPENGTVTLNLTLDHHSYNGGWPVDNCATIAEPVQSPIPEDCVPIVPTTIEKTLIPGQGDCWDAATGLFSCEFQFTITRDFMSAQTAPFDLTDSMPPLTNINGTVTSGNWSCSSINGGTELYCYQNSITNNVDVFTVLITGNSTTAPTENCATLSEVTHIDVLAEACVDIVQTPQPELDILKEIDPSKPCDPAGNCTFIVTISNPSGQDYNGPLSFDDNFFAGVGQISLGVVSSTAGWNCVTTSGGLTVDCTSNTSLNIPAGGSVPVTVTLDLSSGIPVHSQNCAGLTTPAQLPPPISCVAVGGAPLGNVQVTKIMSEDSHLPAPTGSNFPVEVTCNGTLSNADLTAGETVLLSIGHSGATCTIVEGALPVITEPDCEWDAPVYSPSDTISFAPGGVAEVAVINSITCLEPPQMPPQGGGTGISWYLGPETALPIGGTFVTGGMINDQPFTSSEDVSFGDVYDPEIGFRVGAKLPVNDNWSLVGGLGYNRFIGNRVSLGTISEQGPAGLVNNQSLTGVMSDLEQYSIDAGVHYNLPGFKLSDGTDMLPYIEGRLGAAYIPEIAFENARLGQQVFNGGVIPMYKDSWVPKADLRFGVDIPLEKDFTLGVETGLQYSGALRSDNSYFGPGVPLAGTNNNSERWSVPLHVKFGAKF